MSRIHPKYPETDLSHRRGDVDVFVRQEPDEEEDDDEDDDKRNGEEDDDSDDTGDGYSD